MASALRAYAATPREDGKLCAICQTLIGRGEEVGRCPDCGAPFHHECWTENGGCATYGCARMPETVKQEAPPEARSYWGQDEKECPVCAETIKVAAIKCKYCGEMFEDRKPVSQRDYFKRDRPDPELQSGKAIAVATFFFGLLPCTATLTLLVSGLYLAHKQELLKKLPAMHRVLWLAGLATAAVTTVILCVMLVLHE